MSRPDCSYEPALQTPTDVVPIGAVQQALVTLYAPLLADLPADVGDLTDLLGAPIRFEAGQVLFDAGRPCGGFPLLLEGEVKVARGEPNGRSIELYRVVPGEVCIVSVSCLLGQAPLTAHGVATRDGQLLMLPAPIFMRWSAHEPFRRWVFSLFAQRMGDLIALTEAVAFQRLDQRLAAALLGRGPQLELTHQALADELGTVREMVTRLLVRFERDGWVSLGRKRIGVVDAAALRRHAAGEARAGAVADVRLSEDPVSRL